jgi:hypothetical protein
MSSVYYFLKTPSFISVDLHYGVQKISLMHAHLAKLLELGVDEEWLAESNITLEQARELLKGLLYLKEMYPRQSCIVKPSRDLACDLT